MSDYRVKDNKYKMLNLLIVYEHLVEESSYDCLDVPSLYELINLITTCLNFLTSDFSSKIEQSILFIR